MSTYNPPLLLRRSKRYPLFFPIMPPDMALLLTPTGSNPCLEQILLYSQFLNDMQSIDIYAKILHRIGTEA